MARNLDLQKQWARVGAQARLKELLAETAEIYRVFPVLRRQKAGATVAAGTTGTSKKRRFSAAGKRAISEGMRKYWARRKALKARATKSSGK